MRCIARWSSNGGSIGIRRIFLISSTEIPDVGCFSHSMCPPANVALAFRFVADKLGAKGWKCSAEKCHKPDLKCKDTKYTCG